MQDVNKTYNPTQNLYTNNIPPSSSKEIEARSAKIFPLREQVGINKTYGSVDQIPTTPTKNNEIAEKLERLLTIHEEQRAALMMKGSGVVILTDLILAMTEGLTPGQKIYLFASLNSLIPLALILDKPVRWMKKQLFLLKSYIATYPTPTIIPNLFPTPVYLGK